jgi:hypothetical protein
MRTIAIIALVLNALNTFAFDFEIDGKFYNVIHENSVEITFNKDTANSYLSKDVVIPNFVKYNGIEYKVVQIGEFAFDSCSNLNSVVLPESVTIIGRGAFQGCENLNKVEFPNSIEKIGKYAFVLCKNLMSISIPPKVSRIEEGTFAGCESLESIELSENINYIGAVAFMLCKNLKSVTLPKNVDNLQACAIFNVCKNLEFIKVMSEIPPKVNPMLIKDIDLEQVKLSVPIGSKVHYEKAETWKDFARIEEF